jgi:hypothetical protein
MAKGIIVAICAISTGIATSRQAGRTASALNFEHIGRHQSPAAPRLVAAAFFYFADSISVRLSVASWS